MTTYSPLEGLANPGGGTFTNQDGAASYVRWDLYRELGMPAINNLDDYLDLLEEMQRIHPESETGMKTYAILMFKDWDWAGMHNVLASCQMYGYNRQYMTMMVYGDPREFSYYSLDDEAGPYYKFLKFYNEAYCRGIFDPDSATQDFSTVNPETGYAYNPVLWPAEREALDTNLNNKY